ncbi:MAG: LysR substrate-binding domain-containing protein, partial [Pantoea sp.]|nr:LysR substrate-binding domain-containing protein [Pantoea sp.]
MANINWRHIEIFHAVMTSGNLTQAATLLHTSQPTVQGLRLFEEVQRSWYALDRIMESADNLRQFRQGELSVACLPVFSQSLLPPLCQPFLQRYPDVSLNVIPQESPL